MHRDRPGTPGLGGAGIGQNLRVAAVPFQHRPDDKRYNIERVAHFAAGAASAGAQLVVCPEMCLVGYWHLHNHTTE